MLFAGVYLVLKGHFIANNSHINIRSIGQSSDSPNGALQCITDKSPSDCRHRHGEWYLPNGIRNRVTDQYYMFHRSEGHMYGIPTLTKLASSNIWSNLSQIYDQTQIYVQNCCLYMVKAKYMIKFYMIKLKYMVK